MARRTVRIIVLAALLVACGGDGDSRAVAPDSDDEDPSTTQTAVSAPAQSDSAVDQDDSSNGHRATVTIGDLIYDLHSGGIFWVCAHSDSLIAGNYALDNTGSPVQAGNPDVGIQVNYVLLTADATDPQTPMITVQDVAAGTQWQTGEISDVPDAAIREISLVDGVATGTAVFFDLASYLAGNPAVLVDGTFEIVCDS